MLKVLVDNNIRGNSVITNCLMYPAQKMKVLIVIEAAQEEEDKTQQHLYLNTDVKLQEMNLNLSLFLAFLVASVRHCSVSQ